MNARAAKRRSWLGLLIPAVLVFAALVALGTWQLQRKAWKEGLIASLTERLDAPPVALPLPASWPHLDQARDEYRRVKFHAQYENGTEALVYASASAFRPDVNSLGTGYWVFVPAKLPDGAVVVVNRGFVPKDVWNAAARAAAQVSGDIEITGVMRWPDAAHWFTRSPIRRTISGSCATRVDRRRQGLAEGGCHSMSSRNRRRRRAAGPSPASSWSACTTIICNTLLTWYGLALVLVVVFVAYAVKSRREWSDQDAARLPNRPPSHSL